MKFCFLVLLALVMSCGHKKPEKKHYPAVDGFVARWNSDYGPFTPPVQKAFKQYLIHIENFYDDHNVSAKFPLYLSSLSNTHQLLAHAEMNLPSKFKRRYGHWPAQKSPNYLRYQKEQTAELKNKLETARLQRIKQDIGSDLYDRLLIHASKYDKKGQDFKLIL